VTSYEQHEPDEPRGWSPLSVALIAALVLLLGVAGSLYGIRAANRKSAEPPPTRAPQALPTLTQNPVVTPTTTPTPTVPDDTFALPDVTTVDFPTARTKIRELRLGWQLVFEGTDPADASVRATEPAAGTPVRKGMTVKVFVRGAAPLATVPGVTGVPCAQAAALIVDHGLYPTYETGREGVVLTQTPAAADPPTLHWNDKVRISCGTS